MQFVIIVCFSYKRKDALMQRRITILVFISSLKMSSRSDMAIDYQRNTSFYV